MWCGCTIQAFKVAFCGHITVTFLRLLLDEMQHRNVVFGMAGFVDSSWSLIVFGSYEDFPVICMIHRGFLTVSETQKIWVKIRPCHIIGYGFEI